MVKREELKKIQENSFEIWFKRWFEDFKIETRLKESAMKGYKKYAIDCVVLDTYISRRLQDKRFIENLKQKLNDLKIERETETLKGVNIIGIETQKYVNKVIISWE